MISNPLTVPFQRLKRKWRAARGEDLLFAPEIKIATVTLGGPRAAWTFSPDGIQPDSIIYSVGVGEDASFDCELIRRWGVTVHAFDPTPRSITWVETQSLPPQFVFHPYGVAGEDGPRKMHPPRDLAHVSHTIIARNSAAAVIEVPVCSLATIMRELGHEHIDLLKMDIEGAEYEVIADLIESRLDIRQLLVEFHHRWPEVGIARTEDAIHNLHASGYRVFSVSASGEEYGFLKI